MRSLHLAMIALAALAACGDSASDSKPPTLDASLQAVADEAGLTITDVSVPFERLMQAPKKLQAVNRALQIGPPGVYVMRYSDDTLRHTLHVFVIANSKRVYVKLTTAPGENVVKEEFIIHGSNYEDNAESLILDTQAGVVRLTPQDVTPVGA